MNSDVVATLDVAALRHNLTIVRELAPQSQIMAVVKANAYGHGIDCLWQPIATQADGMAVARVSEAIYLRQLGYEGTLLVMSGFDDGDDLHSIDEYRLQTVIHNLAQIALLKKHVLRHPLTVWLKLETGMHRLGLTAEDFSAAYTQMKAHSSVQDIILMTHFASSECRDADTTTRQMAAFQQATKFELERRRVSMSNSAGILAWPTAHRHWVRPGLMMYGGSPFKPMEKMPLLKPVMQLTAPIRAINTIKAGDAVGYNGLFIADKPMTIAVVGAGYGDGYPRSLPNGTPVWLNGKMAKTVGRVSMDSVMIDISDRREEVAIGHRAVLWGPELAVEMVAEYADRDPREVLCGVSMPRVQRKIIGENHGTNHR